MITMTITSSTIKTVISFQKVVDWNPGKKISVVVGGETKVYKSEAICQVSVFNVANCPSFIVRSIHPSLTVPRTWPT